MKRILHTLAFASLSLLAMGEPVDRNAAFYTAKNYLISKGRALTEAKSPFRAARKSKGMAESAYYYVFNAEGENGYVIVSGDTRTPEILGYVEHGSFDADNIPVNMKSMLQLYADEIKYLDDNNVPESSPMLKVKRKSNVVRRSIPEILTSRWNQGHPYNLTCPKYYKKDGTQDYPATGCTATAMAQVMNFYKYPEKTKAVIPAISNSYTLDNGTTKKVTTKAIPRNTVIDWENMRDTYDCDDKHKHDIQDTAVANLMYYCGQAVNMGYGASSGANFSASAYINYFGFDDSAYVGERGNYTIDEWFDLFYNEVSQGYPVLISGFSSGGGHAFVVDGFDGEQLFHLNWGWGGGSNGWFLLGILNPGDNSGIGASSSSDGYSMSQRALFNLRLPDNIKVEKDTHLSIHDIKVSGTSISANYINWTGSTNTFHSNIVMRNEDGTFSPVCTTQTLTDLSNNTYQSKTFNLRSRLQPGTYMLSPASKLSTAKIWRPEYDCKRTYIRADVDENKNITLTKVEPIEDIAIDTVIFTGKCIVGQQQEVKVTYRNNGDEYYHEVKMFASKTDVRVYTESRSEVAVRKGETVVVSYFFKPTEEGTYTLWFSRNDNGQNEIGSCKMQVVSEANAQKDNLAVSSLTFTNSVSGVIYGDRMIGVIKVKNNAKVPFHGAIKVSLWRQPAGENVAWSQSSRQVQLDIEPGKISQGTFEFTGLDNTSTYRLPIDYVGQSGNLSGWGLWDHGYTLKAGMLYWKENGTIAAKSTTTSFTPAKDACALYAKNLTVRNFSVSGVTNPNVMFCLSDTVKMRTRGLDGKNVVIGNHADVINLTDGYPYYCPINFEVDTAYFHHLLPEDADGTRWQTFTMPFDCDSLCIDGQPYALNDSTNHFAIYEFSALSPDNEVVFSPAENIRANTPYIITCDATLAGKTLSFIATDIDFFKSGNNKMVLSSSSYTQYGTTFKTSQTGAYVLNQEGNAFVYVEEGTDLEALTSYFVTSLSEDKRAKAILLPVVTFPKEDTDYITRPMETKAITTSPWYDMLGRRVSRPASGLYINGGEKVVK